MQQLTQSMEKLGNKFDMFSNDFSNRLTKIETMFTMFDKSQTNLSNKVDDVERVAHDANASTKAAHKRLDGMDEEIEKIPTITSVDERLKKMEQLVSRVLFWVTTTIIGGIILGAITLLFKSQTN